MSEPYPIPVNALFGTDFVSQLILLMSNDTIPEAADKIAYHSVGRRVAAREAPMAVHYEGRRIEDGQTVAEAGIASLQFVFVDYVS